MEAGEKDRGGDDGKEGGKSWSEYMRSSRYFANEIDLRLDKKGGQTG